jgi:transmembrane 9 superfamily protein 2/4
VALLLSFACATRIYQAGDPLPIRVKPLTFGGNSIDEKLYLYPVDYYNETLDNCSPQIQQVKFSPESNETSGYGTFFNSKLEDSPFNTTFNNENRCTLVCDKDYKKVNVTLINDLIKRNYKLNFYVDDMPVGRELYDSQTSKFYIDFGVPLGYLDIEKVPHMFNHFQFIVYYKAQGLDYEVLYATVSTQSFTRIPQVPLRCALSPPMLLRYSDYAYNGNRVSYSVIYKEIEVSHGLNKWDLYRNDVVRPFIYNAIVLMFALLTALIFSYTYYTLKHAFTVEKLNVIYKKKSSVVETTQSDDETVEIDELYDFSWPALINDVFREPSYSSLLYYLVSQGFQVFIIFTFVVLQLGFGFNIYKGDLFNNYGLVYFYVAAIHQSLLNAYLLTLFQSINQDFKTKTNAVISALLNSFSLPTFLHIIVHYTNHAHGLVNSPIHISATLFNSIILKYILTSAVSFAISFFALRGKGVSTYPAVNEIAKEVSGMPITFKLIPNSIITGIFPFGVVLIPLSTVYLSIWYNHFFSNNTFLLIFQFILLVTLIASINALNLYYLLSIGNWKWQWKSFVNGASLGVFSFLYTLNLTKFKFGDYSSFLIALLHNITISLMLALLGGFVSFTVSLFIVKKLYTNMN